jgi:Actin-like ATPase involved in cell division
MTHLLVVDIGSSQVRAAVAEMLDGRRIAVRGLGHARSNGLKQGVVIQIDSVVEALNRAVSEANTMAGTRLTDPLISVGGSHLVGQDVVGTVMLNHREVTDTLLTEAMAQFRLTSLSPIATF